MLNGTAEPTPTEMGYIHVDSRYGCQKAAPSRAWGCPNLSLNICMARSGQAKVLGGRALPGPRPA